MSKQEEIKPHVDSGRRCLVAHYHKNGELAPGCIRCSFCKEWIRPKYMKDCCPARYPRREVPAFVKEILEQVRRFGKAVEEMDDRED